MTAESDLYAPILGQKRCGRLIAEALPVIGRTGHLSVDAILNHIRSISPHAHASLISNPEWILKLDVLVRLHTHGTGSGSMGREQR